MRRWLLIGAVTAAAVIAPQFFLPSGLHADVISIAGGCLVLWLSEAAPPFVPAFLLWALIPLALGRYDAGLDLSRALGWAADPVLALFLGGFALGVAAERHGLDTWLIARAIRFSGRSFATLLLIVIFITAFLSMWLSNIAAAALMLACLRPAFGRIDSDDLLRRTLLSGVALGAGLGGMATPIGTGPNAVAIAALAGAYPITFVKWMVFALPLAVGMLLLIFALLWWRSRSAAASWEAVVLPKKEGARPLEPQPSHAAFYFIGIATVVLWLTEPIHGIAAAVVSILAAAALFLSGALDKDALRRIDWSTLILIAGGITLGKLLESTGVIASLSGNIPFDTFDKRFALFLICFATAFMAAIMSNTASVIMIIPLAAALIPAPSTAILVAVSASFGLPFIISTPMNAMAYGEGGLKTGDLLWPGLVIMCVGCALVALTGPYILGGVGIP